MKITKQYLKQVIKEELEQALNEFGQNSPIRKKQGTLNYAEPGGIDDIPNDSQARSYDSKLVNLIRQNNDPFTAAKTMEKYANYGKFGDGVSPPEGLALYVIAHKHRASQTEEGNKVWSAYKNNIEGKTKDGGSFVATEFLTIGGGSFNRKKMEELFPGLFKELANKKQTYR